MYTDRTDAGICLAQELKHLAGRADVVVVGLPRGGVPVAYEVAVALGVPLDVILVRKLGVPFQPELAMGAIGEDGVRVLDAGSVRFARISNDELLEVERRERAEMARRAVAYRADRKRVRLAGHHVVIVDDGIATGSTARAACEVVRAQGASRVVMAVPVAPREWTYPLKGYADEFVCPSTPWDFAAVGQFYEDFEQTSDEIVVACLDRAASRKLPSRR